MRSPLFLAGVLAILTPTEAAAQVGPGVPIGSAVRVVNSVTAVDVGVPRSLAAGDGINQDESIEVAPNSLGELRLNDETKLALGPGAKLKLDKFVYDPAKSSGTIAVDLTKGAFRFITGNARKPSYLIRSPNASISVRGTIFDVYVDATGYMWILLHEGSIEVCNSRGQCSELNQACGLVRVGANGDLSGAATWNRQPAVREIDFETAFPFVVRPPQIDPAPRYTRAAVEAGSCPSGDIKPPKTRRAEAEQPVEPASPSEPSRPLPQRAMNDVIASDDNPPDYTQPRRVTYDPPSDASDRASDTPPAGSAAPFGRPIWSGFYLGLSGGYAANRQEVDVGCADGDASSTFLSLYDPNNCAYAQYRQASTTTYTPEPDGFTGGGVAGFNVQSGSFLAGMETDMSWSSVAGKDKKSTDVGVLDPEDGQVTQELKWLGTARGRIGYATGNWLLFATGGLAFGEVEMSYELSLPRTGGYAFDSKSKTMAGWTLGAGAEVSLGAVSLKGEILHFDLGEEELSARGHFANGARSSTTFEPEFETKGNIGRVGLNYHLN